MVTIRVLLAVLASVAGCGWGGEGIAIQPDKDGLFVYEDDYATPRCLTEAFLVNTDAKIWQPGALQTTGPARHRTAIYRFHGHRVITAGTVTVEQKANARHLGGQTWLYVSRNGLDWTLVADSATQADDANGWQGQPFQITGDVLGAAMGAVSSGCGWSWTTTAA